MSIRYSGVARRSFIIGSSEWPPASSRASGPSCASSSSAWSTLVARSYSNGAGTCTESSRQDWRRRALGLRRCSLSLTQSCASEGGSPTGLKRSLRSLYRPPRRPDSHDPRPAAVVRARRPPRVGQGRGGRARGHRARRVGRRRGAAQGARRRAVRPRRAGDRADPRRPAAGGAGQRDPRSRRAGAALGPGLARPAAA